MRLCFAVAAVSLAVLALIVPAQRGLADLTYDPWPSYGGATKIFYEGWGYVTSPVAPRDLDQTPNNWTRFSTGANVFVAADETAICHGETVKTNPPPGGAAGHSLRFGRSDALPFEGAYSNVATVVAESSYDINAWARSKSPDPGAVIAIGYDLTGQTTDPQAATIVYDELQSGGQNTWIEYVKTVVATGTQISVFLKFGHPDEVGTDPSYGYFDGVQVTLTGAIEPPNTLTNGEFQAGFAGGTASGWVPYQVNGYRGWSAITPNTRAYICYGVSGLGFAASNCKKPANYYSTTAVRESNDWTNPPGVGLEGSAAYGEPAHASGTYLDGRQYCMVAMDPITFPGWGTIEIDTHKNTLWMDYNGDYPGEGPRVQLVLKHDIPSVPEWPDHKKLRVGAEYWCREDITSAQGCGVRIYFDGAAGGEVTVDLAVHFNRNLGWRVIGVAEHPEWETWTDTNQSLYTIDAKHWNHIGIDCDQITPGALTFIYRGPKELGANPVYYSDSWAMVCGVLPGFAQYVTGAKAIAVGQVDENPADAQPVAEDNWLDNVWICTGITEDAVATIDGCKTSGTGRRVHLTGEVVSAAFIYGGTPVSFTLEKRDRSSAVRVMWNGSPAVSEGDTVEVYGGLVDQSSGERVVSAVLVNKGAPDTVPAPLGVTNLAAGGGQLGGQIGMSDRGAGTNNVAMLCTLWGRVVPDSKTGQLYYGPSDSRYPFPDPYGRYHMYVDDGSGVLADYMLIKDPNTATWSSEGQFTGVKVYYPGSYIPMLGDWVMCTGIVGIEQSDSNYTDAGGTISYIRTFEVLDSTFQASGPPDSYTDMLVWYW